MKTLEGVVNEFWLEIPMNDFTSTSLLLAEDDILSYPRSNETFYGREDFVRLNSSRPAYGCWRFSVHQPFAEDTQVVKDVNVTDSVGKGEGRHLFDGRERADQKTARVLTLALRSPL